MGKVTKRRYFHATDFKNIHNIMIKGLKPGCDGVVYLAETKEDALKFVAFRFYEKIVVIEVELEESEVEETFDHNYNFFQCKAFGCLNPIPLKKMVDFWEYSKKS